MRFDEGRVPASHFASFGRTGELGNRAIANFWATVINSMGKTLHVKTKLLIYITSALFVLKWN